MASPRNDSARKERKQNYLGYYILIALAAGLLLGKTFAVLGLLLALFVGAPLFHSLFIANMRGGSSEDNTVRVIVFVIFLAGLCWIFTKV